MNRERIVSRLVLSGPTVGGCLLGTGLAQMVRYQVLLPGLPLAVVGVVLIVAATRRMAREAREDLRLRIITAVRVWPGMRASEMGGRVHAKPRRLRPLLDRWVESGDVVRVWDFEQDDWTYDPSPGLRLPDGR